MERDNPWQAFPELVVDKQRPVRPDVCVLGGANWRMLDRYPLVLPNIPVINLVQHVKHADSELRLKKFLRRKAIRICVSDQVANELRATELTVGPLVVIPNGIDLTSLPARRGGQSQVDVLIAGLKEPELAAQVADRLARDGRHIDVLVEQLSRPDFLARIQEARVTVFLPHETEGFYLPALEGMALGTIVVCPDCIGNRSYCLPGHNAFRPNYTIDDIVRDVETALALPSAEAHQLLENARQTAAEHSLERERQTFLDVLHNIDELWRGMDDITEPSQVAYDGSSRAKRAGGRARPTAATR
jgi:hypothetical protein